MPARVLGAGQSENSEMQLNSAQDRATWAPTDQSGRHSDSMLSDCHEIDAERA